MSNSKKLLYLLSNLTGDKTEKVLWIIKILIINIMRMDGSLIDCITCQNLLGYLMPKSVFFKDIHGFK